VRRVKIPKPDGGTRNLGIPTVIDRVIQQAVLRRLQPRWDPTFSEHSYGFRPGRSAHQAVAQAQAYVIAGHRFVVDLAMLSGSQIASMRCTVDAGLSGRPRAPAPA
jgi:RNA-directed DNA polymerase